MNQSLINDPNKYLKIQFDLINQWNERCKDRVSTHQKEFINFSKSLSMQKH
jgi:hypothetical protein